MIYNLILQTSQTNQSLMIFIIDESALEVSTGLMAWLAVQELKD